MKLADLMKKLEASPEFKKWRKANPACYLTGLFNIKEGAGWSNWTVSYYDQQRDRMTSFEVGINILAKPESEVVHESTEVRPLIIASAKIEPDKAIAAAEAFMRKSYPTESVLKTIVILQNIRAGQVWNITFLTHAFNTLNIRLDAGTGKVVEQKLTPIFDFVQKSK